MFYNCWSLKSLDFLDRLDTSGVTNMNGVFRACTLLKEIDISTWDMSNVTVSNSLFNSCTNMERVVYPDSMTRVGQSQFNYCLSLLSVRIPPNVTSIAPYAFEYTQNLILFDFRDLLQVPVLENANAFTNNTNPNKKIVVPDSLYEQWKSANNWNALSQFIVSASDYSD